MAQPRKQVENILVTVSVRRSSTAYLPRILSINVQIVLALAHHAQLSVVYFVAARSCQ